MIRPPLGCKPYYVALQERINELAAAITRYSEGDINNIYLISLWSKELYYLAEVMKKLEKDYAKCD